MKNKVDILNLEWTSIPCRDRVISSLVCNYLKMLGFSVFEGSIFNGYRLIKKLKPKILFISNSVGAPINTDIVEYANKRGIICFSSFSEGNFRENMIHEFIWGHNSANLFWEEALFVWSEDKKKMLLKYYPELKDQVTVSGGIGFDIYQILKDKYSPERFLNTFGKKDFSKIIGIGCFDFGPFFEMDTRNNLVLQRTNSKDIHTIQSDRDLFRNVLEEIIKANKEILFVLKQHPSNELGSWASAIEGLEEYGNVLVLKNELPIFDCIAISDFWITYESTTALEAWLLGKETCLLNPLGGDFYRDEISSGSPIYQNASDIQNAIDLHYSGNTISGFKEKAVLRDTLIKNAIQWSDGFNHVRAGNVIVNCFNTKVLRSFKEEKKSAISFELKSKAFKQNFFWWVAKSIERYFTFLRKISYIDKAVKMRYFSMEQLNDYSADLMKSQKNFFEKHKLSIKSLQEIKSI